jgi:hypothetical protein
MKARHCRAFFVLVQAIAAKTQVVAFLSRALGRTLEILPNQSLPAKAPVDGFAGLLDIRA